MSKSFRSFMRLVGVIVLVMLVIRLLRPFTSSLGQGELPLRQDQVEFSISTRLEPRLGNLRRLNAQERASLGRGSEALYWGSQTAYGHLVAVDLKTGQVYGVCPNYGKRLDEYHEIGQLRMDGKSLHVDFLEGAQLVYREYGYGRLVHVRIPGKTAVVFTKSRSEEGAW